ncbi:MAG: hypothetical protein A3F84_12465 [Candidatus Handelsmanbacteria bacterium RIFCSPLOWO2_12_FULL_64_10]|uniref:AmmeMemoRadiSam system radical SAM enzyme n=1 Tax=Handelsmanbacteria sp. (strain RIFCSPLOWO2_12_FULL_64_10) TaxID=1817868 RepID=A0A1F6CCM5_HANXR|nr:MAG: hypothetical protein A3F84_12465 [Candidatus Handelsmanbacteria bacterium RIFCSPLOWO2_12_FULL_64_10]
MPETLTLEQALRPRTREGELYERLPDDNIRCFACGHRCLIREGRPGICKVRYNAGGKLYVPWGYVAGVQLDPIEKKPFFHAYPGASALSFGMLGCYLHCPYCFTPDTRVVTDRGVLRIADAFDASGRKVRLPDGEIAFPSGLRAVTSSGGWRKVAKVFRHPYRGDLVLLNVPYLPPLRCTPDHRLYVSRNGSAPAPVPAGELRPGDYLAIPRHYAFSTPQVVDVQQALAPYATTFKPLPPSPSPEGRGGAVLSIRQGARRRRANHRGSEEALGCNGNLWSIRLLEQCPCVAPSPSRRLSERFSAHSFGVKRVGRRHGPPEQEGWGSHDRLPTRLPIDTAFAWLLGLYCAEGCVTKSSRRPNSHTLMLSFGKPEAELRGKAADHLHRTFGRWPRTVEQRTTVQLQVSSASVSLIFASLCGASSAEKRVPPQLFDAPRSVVESFLAGYLSGDGHRTKAGKTSCTTVSEDLAWGVAWLALKLGHFPALYTNEVEAERTIEGRTVRTQPRQHSVVWYDNNATRRRLTETEGYYLIPITSIHRESYDGEVYNLEVEGEHDYLAGLFLVKNCQNYITSQALRDPEAVVPPRDISPEQFVDLARRYGAKVITSTYNEPLITSEWAVAIFKLARESGLICSYVSNGNGTPEVLDYIRPCVDLYKVDLKSFDDRHYRKLGGTLQAVLDTIRMLHERGFWVEIVTLTIPGFNDSDAELRDLARFLVSVSPDIPWHVTAFHKDYKMQDPDNTPVETLLRAAEMGRKEGLRYVYVGNLPGLVGDFENTRCPSCDALLIERSGYRILQDRIQDGACYKCGTPIPGRWDRQEGNGRFSDAPVLIRFPKPNA